MWIHAFRTLSPRIPWSLLLALLLMLTVPATVTAASATEATTPDCESGLEPLSGANRKGPPSSARLSSAWLAAPSRTVSCSGSATFWPSRPGARFRLAGPCSVGEVPEGSAV